MYIFGIYLPPQASVGAVEMFERINEEITKAKLTSKNPYIFVGGDNNRKQFSEAFADHPDIGELQSPPSRCPHILDLAASNENEKHMTTTTAPPLSDENGYNSDHLTLIFSYHLKTLTSVQPCEDQRKGF